MTAFRRHLLCVVSCVALALAGCGGEDPVDPDPDPACFDGERRCGDDGGIEICSNDEFQMLGSCPTGTVCLDGECVSEEPCIPDCEGRECGPDPVCGITCGNCNEGYSCNEAGLCVPDGCRPDPPYTSTAYIDSNVISTDDYSTLQSTSYTGQDMRWMFDRRIDDWEYLYAYLFDAVFDDGLTTEVQVNPEFASASNAMLEADKYAFIIGQLPACLRSQTHRIWIHQGDESFGGGFNGVLIHTGRSPEYETLGILEEVLFHETTHTALDPFYASEPDWISAQDSDCGFISTYAASSPMIEDIAESFLAWFMVRQCDRRVSVYDSLTIEQTIPNRIAFFDSKNFAMYPLCINKVDAPPEN